MERISLSEACKRYGFIDLVAAVKQGRYTVSCNKVVDITLRNGTVAVSFTLKEMVVADLLVEATKEPIRIVEHIRSSAQGSFWFSLSAAIKQYYHLV